MSDETPKVEPCASCKAVPRPVTPHCVMHICEEWPACTIEIDVWNDYQVRRLAARKRDFEAGRKLLQAKWGTDGPYWKNFEQYLARGKE